MITPDTNCSMHVLHFSDQRNDGFLMDFLLSIMCTDSKQLLLDNAKTYVNENSFGQHNVL